MKLCLDLCAGLAGLSRAFKEAGWTILTIDNDPRFKPTICKDVRNITVQDICDVLGVESLRPHFEKIVMVMSPPCQRWSKANPAWPKKGIRDASEIVGACLELVAEIQPDYWLMENPVARLRWFIASKPTATIRLRGLGYRTVKPTDLWGNIPFQLLPDSGRTNQAKSTRSRTNWGSRPFDGVRDPAKRAEMPLGLSKTILKAVES